MTSPSSKRPLKVGLTGGIASGKSTVADMFAAHGVPVIDTDVIAREIVRPGEPALEEIRQAFGASVIDEGGGLDRAAMRRRVFEDEEARRRLEAILHPRIRALTIGRAEAAEGPYRLVVVPLLDRSPLKDYVDRVLVVDVDEQTQLDRLLARDAGSEAEARRILAAQASREERLAIADDVIANDGALDDTRRQVDALHERYLELAR